MMNKTAILALLMCLTVAVGCAQESPSYNEQAAKIDPAMNTPEPDPPSPSSLDGDQADDKVELTEEQWRSILSDEEYDILRKSGTEMRFTGRHLKHPTDKKGSFHCVGCGNKLYDAKHKFHSGCGWPSFNQEVEPGAITTHEDYSYLNILRIEMRCARCDGHLGHIFQDAPDQPTGLRHCVNGNILIFVPEGADPQTVIAEHRKQFADK